MIVIAFGGLARAGKTTTAKAAAKFLFNDGYHPCFVSFADPIKAELKAKGLTKESDPQLYRTEAIVLGRGHRKKNPLYFVDKMMERLQSIHQIESGSGSESERVVLIDDLRFDNEIKALDKMGAVTVFVDGFTRIDDLDAPFRTDVSEKLATDYTYGRLPDTTFDFVIVNHKSKTLEEYDKLVGEQARWWLYPED